MTTASGDLSPAKQALLRQLLSGRTRLAAAPTRTIQERRGEDAPLSQSQVRLYEWELANPERARTMNLFYVLRLRGPFDMAQLRAALQDLVERHENLRMYLAGPPADPRAHFANHVSPDVPLVNLSHLGEVEAEQEAMARARVRGAERFDLRVPPLARAVVYQLAPRHFLLLLAVHHLIFDEWSMGVVVRELSSLYVARTQGKRASLPPLRFQFGDYAASERRWFDGDGLDAQKEFWAEELSGQLPSLRLPARKDARPADFAHGRLDIALGVERTARVEGFSKDHDVSPFMTLVTTLAVLLVRLGDTDEVVVGIPAANRNCPDVQDLIGFFVNNVPLRVKVRRDTPFIELLREVRRKAVRALANQEFPSGWMGELLDNPPEGRGLAQVVFSFQNSPVPEFELGGLSVQPLLLDYGMTTVDLSIFLIDASTLTSQAGQYAGMIHHNAEVYDRPAVHDLWRRYRRVLDRCLMTPSAHVGALSIE